jgi:hypothetical protein
VPAPCSQLRKQPPIAAMLIIGNGFSSVSPGAILAASKCDQLIAIQWL